MKTPAPTRKTFRDQCANGGWGHEVYSCLRAVFWRQRYRFPTQVEEERTDYDPRCGWKDLALPMKARTHVTLGVLPPLLTCDYANKNIASDEVNTSQGTTISAKVREAVADFNATPLLTMNIVKIFSTFSACEDIPTTFVFETLTERLYKCSSAQTLS